MFCGSLAEETKEITIPDVEPQAFTNLLKWVQGKTDENLYATNFDKSYPL